MLKDPDKKALSELIHELHKYFSFHEKNEYAEFIFLILGIVYFIEAVIKNSLDLFRGHW